MIAPELKKDWGEYRLVLLKPGFYRLEKKTGSAALGEAIWQRVCDIDQGHYHDTEQVTLPMDAAILLCREVE